MRIAFYGNTCNNFLAVARAVRRASDIDAHLFIDSDADWMQLPESEDPELRDNYPDWMHKGPYHTFASRFWPGSSPLVRELERFDVVIVSGGGVRLAPFVDRPFIFYVTGWDLTMAPFPIRFFGLPPHGVARKGAALLGGFWQRRGIAAVDELWSQPFSPFRIAADRLRIEPGKIVPKYFPIMIDTNLYRADPDARRSTDPNVRRLVDNHDFVVFHPARMMMNRAPQFVEAGNWKGNDRLLEGFARFCADNPSARPVLALIDRDQSPDLLEAKQMIHRLGIEDRVAWLRGRQPRGFDRAEMVPLYSVADVVADEFAIGFFGSIVLEGLSVGKPVLCYLQEDVMKQLYPWHPVLSPRTPDQIAECLTDLYRNPGKRRQLGERGREWAIEFHSLEQAAAHYVKHIVDMADARSSRSVYAAPMEGSRAALRSRTAGGDTT